MRHNPGKTNHTQTQTHAKGKQNNKTSELVISIDIEFYVFEKARKKNKQIYENYKIHVIFAYYYKTILLSFINKKKTRERETHKYRKQNTRTRQERYTERLERTIPSQTFSTDTLISRSETIEKTPLFAIIKLVPFTGKQKFTHNARNAKVTVIFTLEKQENKIREESKRRMVK